MGVVARTKGKGLTRPRELHREPLRDLDMWSGWEEQGSVLGPKDQGVSRRKYEMPHKRQGARLRRG